MSSALQVDRFIDALQCFGARPLVFNPWADYDEENDSSPRNAEVRASQLRRYLMQRVGRARKLLMAEAPGFQGCHFTGIPMTSERILLGHCRHHDIYPADVLDGEVARTSKGSKPGGFAEPTATIVWKSLKLANANPRDVVLWNAFAFHPMKSGWLTNRKPSAAELDDARYLLEMFLELFPEVSVVPVGRVSEAILGTLGVACAAYVRHPANGGASAFTQGMTSHWPSPA
jgi:hypothetical protein